MVQKHIHWIQWSKERLETIFWAMKNHFYNVKNSFWPPWESSKTFTLYYIFGCPKKFLDLRKHDFKWNQTKRQCQGDKICWNQKREYIFTSSKTVFLSKTCKLQLEKNSKNFTLYKILNSKTKFGTQKLSSAVYYAFFRLSDHISWSL